LFRSLLKPLKAHFDAAVQQMQEKFEALEKQREEFEQLYDTDSAELGASLQSLERRSPRAHARSGSRTRIRWCRVFVVVCSLPVHLSPHHDRD
jgi:hypothetical protein